MEPARIFALLAVAGTAGLIVAMIRLGRERRMGVPPELLRWAQESGHRVAGDGVWLPLQVVGSEGTRLFTVSWHPGPPPTLLIAVDCDVPEEFPGAPGSTEVSDGTLVSRWIQPQPDHYARIGELVEALVAHAIALEQTATRLGVTTGAPAD